MPYLIRSTARFSAAHQLRLPDGSLEPMHGHNWKATITVAAEQLDAIGTVMDFHELDRMLADVVKPMKNTHLNELRAFVTLNPSTENVAIVIANALKLPPGVMLRSVEVWETDESSAIYEPA